MNPLFGPNRFKLGIFSANCDGGLTMSLAPERWKADWDDIVAMTRIADDAGLEFILRYSGVWRQGDRHHRSRNPRPRRPEHRVRLEPGGVRPARRDD
jgi:hypothetical protein